MNLGYQNIRYYTPYQVFNPYQNRLRNKFFFNFNQEPPKYNFSQLGYQIIHPPMISYHLEPIYSSMITTKSKLSSIEVGKPVFNSRNTQSKYNSLDSYRSNNFSSISFRNDLNRNYLPSTDDITKSKRRNSEKSFLKKDTKLKENITPFIHFFKNSNKKNSIFNLNSNKKRTKFEWMKLFQNFVNIYVFFSSAKKYSCERSKLRNKLINERITHVVNDIAILKDWIISIEEPFFNEFKNYKKFNGELITQGEQNIITKKNILKNINIYINNLKSNLDQIPQNVQNILYKYIKDNSYFPKKYLSKFEINRIDFNFYGASKDLSSKHSAMILSYLIINGVTIQQILLHIKEVFTEYAECFNIEKAAINLGSVLHNLVKKIFGKKLKLKNDVLALFNYYRNYHLFDKNIEKYKDKITEKIDIEENESEDEYNKNLLHLHQIKIFFSENNKTLDEFMEKIYDWALELSKNLRTKFSSSKDININLSRKNSKIYNIKSKILNAN